MTQENLIEVFVIMPFGNNGEYRDGNKESDYIYNAIITPGIRKVFGKEAQIKICREVDRNAPGSITSGIVKSLAQSDIVIADLTGRNPNVYLELGIRFALRTKITILIAQKETIPPFDVGDYRMILYSVVEPEAAQNMIASAIQEANVSSRSDSLVFDTFSEISVVVPGYCESHGGQSLSTETVMFWPQYWNRISQIIDWIHEPAQNGQFTPDAVLGISNGGLVAADLIGRMLFRGTPILSLWANRFSKPPGDIINTYWFFDNELNNAIVDSLRTKTQGRRAVLLLLDDHLGTGTTVRQAHSYLQSQFNGEADILYIPMFSNRPEYVEAVEELLPYRYQDGKIFPRITRESFWESVKTSFNVFPYMKEISSGA